MRLTEEKIKKNMQRDADVTVFDVIDSTNNEAKRRISAPVSRPALYAARCQTAGRGRRGHTFYSPADTGLYLSLVLPIQGDSIDTCRLTCAAAVATADAIESLLPVRVGIKWVNDLYVSHTKVCGILCELITDEHNCPLGVCVGIGVNLTTTCFPNGIAAGCVGDADPSLLCARIADRLIGYGERSRDNAFMAAYIRRSIVIGKTVHYTDSRGEHTARAVAIDDNGCLVTEENGSRRILDSGEISVKL